VIISFVLKCYVMALTATAEMVVCLGYRQTELPRLETSELLNVPSRHEAVLARKCSPADNHSLACGGCYLWDGALVRPDVLNMPELMSAFVQGSYND